MVSFFGQHRWIFFVGLCKSYCLPNRSREVIDLLRQITEANTTVTVDKLARAWQEIEHRLDILCAADGAHVKVFKYI